MKKKYDSMVPDHLIEFKLILKVISNYLTKQKMTQQEIEADINWELFLQLVRHHRVTPIAYIQFRDAQFIPDYVIKRLYNENYNHLIWMLQLSKEMSKVTHLLAKNEIPSLQLKGPVLSLNLYGDLGLRTSSDLDILVPIEQLEKAEHMLFKLGYQKEDYIHSVLNDWKWRHHHNTYINTQNKVKVELHWRLHPGPAKNPTFTELWERKRGLVFGETMVNFLGKEDLLLFLTIHGARHGWSRIRWLVDIHQLIGKDIDPEMLLILLKKYHGKHILGQALILVNGLFNKNLNVFYGRFIRGGKPILLAEGALYYLHQMINLHTEPVPLEVSLYHKRYLFALMSKRQKTLFLLSFFYPYPNDAETLPLPKVLHFLYFPLRPILLIWRKTRKRVLTQEVDGS